jgi:starch synthase
VKVYEKRDLWLKVIQNAMKQDLSWNNSAQKYIKLYQKLLTGKGPGK